MDTNQDIQPAFAPRPDNVPPGHVLDFDIYNPVTDGSDIHRAWCALQDADLPDIVWTPHNGGHWMVLRGPLVEEVLTDYEHFSNYTVLVPKDTAGVSYRLLPLSLDPPEHRPFRNLLNANLSPKALQSTELAIRALTIELIEGFRAQGHCNFIEDFAEKLPIRIFMQMVSLPMEDLPKLKHLADQFTRPDGSLTYPEVAVLFREYMGPVIKARRGSDANDVLTNIINGRIDDRPLTDLEAANICIQLLVGGLDTVVNFMGYVMLFLAQNAGFRDMLADNPAKIPDAIMEFLRRFPLVSTAREVRQNFTYQGVHLKAGDMVLATSILHGLDESENPNAFEVHLNRVNPKHSTFGKGSHTCPGAHLARMELRIMIEEWVTRLPDFHLVPAQHITFGGGVVSTVHSYILEWT